VLRGTVRTFKKPVHVIARDLKQVAGLVRFSGAAQLLAEEFWPGPLTLVLPLKKAGPSWSALSAGLTGHCQRRPRLSLAAEAGQPSSACAAQSWTCCGVCP
jgi:L-threonylcarbamoyladenylate synthase